MKVRLAILMTAAVFWISVRALAWRPDWVEHYYSQSFGQWIALGLSRLSAFLPLSLAEVAATVASVALLAFFLRALSQVRRGRRRLGDWMRSWALNALVALALAGASFYLFWGLNYYRPSLVERLNWQSYRDQESEPSDELAVLCRQLVVATNQARAKLPSLSKSQLQTEAESALEIGYERVARHLGLPDVWRRKRGPAKPLWSSRLLSHLGISGMYVPWTGEASVNRLVPESQLAHVIAHEKAHQRGIASEDEANFFGFLACIHSPSPAVRYSGLLFSQRRLLGELYKRSPEKAWELVGRRSQEVAADIEASNRFWQSYQGAATRVSQAVNDSYLRFHGVAGGIRSYQLSSRLLVIYARSRGGSLL